MSISEKADIAERLLSWCIDWNGAPMVDGEQPRIIPRVRDLRDAADEIKRLSALSLHQHAAPGWKLVPEDPTHAMKQAGYCAWLRADKTQVYGEAIFDRAYVAALAAAPPAPALHQHAQPAGREALMRAAKSAVEQWADWCHNNEAQWSGWGDMVVPEGATMWTADAERVLAAFAPPAPVQEDLDRREIACLRAAVTDAGAYIALCPPPPEATGSLRIELLERRERIGKAAALIAEKDAQ